MGIGAAATRGRAEKQRIGSGLSPPGFSQNPAVETSHRCVAAEALRSVPQGHGVRRGLRNHFGRQLDAHGAGPAEPGADRGSNATDLDRHLLRSFQLPARPARPPDGSRRGKRTDLMRRLASRGSDCSSSRLAGFRRRRVVRAACGRGGAAEQHQRAPFLFWIALLHSPRIRGFRRKNVVVLHALNGETIVAQRPRAAGCRAAEHCRSPWESGPSPVTLRWGTRKRVKEECPCFCFGFAGTGWVFAQLFGHDRGDP